MKYSQLRRGLSPEDAAAYVGSKELLRQFERAKWLKPFVRGNRLTRFDIRDLDGCIDRYLYRAGLVDKTLPFEELRRRSRINDAALAADNTPDFSQRIRASLPTMQP